MRFFLWVIAAVACLAQAPVPINNEWVRVIRAANVPGQLSRPHVHLVNRVMIHLDKGTLRIDNKETGVARDIPFQAGEVRWDPRVGLHTSENVGGSAIRIVEIELKDKPTRATQAPLAKPGVRFQAVMENSQVRVLRTSLTPGEEVREAAFTTPVIAVRLKDGDTRWLATGEFAVKNDGEQAGDWVLVEVK